MSSDLRLAFRSLLARPLLTLTALVALALGTGAAVLVFTVVNGVLLRALPYERAERVVIPRATNAGENRRDEPLTWGDWAALRELPGVFGAAGAVTFEYPDLTGVAEPEQLRLGRVDGALFSALGVRPVLGRAFTADELAANAPVAMLNVELWQKHFGGDPAIVGRTVTMDRAPVTVVGIMPRVRLGYNEYNAWRPADPAWAAQAERTQRVVFAVARLADGVAPTTAEAALAQLGTRLAAAYPKESGGWTLRGASLREFEVGDRRAQLLVLLGATGLVLLVACANVAHLLLARGEQRRREVAVRTALGASRWRVVRQALAESLLLAAAGGAGGLALAVVARPLLLELSPLSEQQREAVTFDVRVLLAMAAAVVVTGLLFGLAPAWASARADAQEAMRSGGRGTTGAGAWRLRGALVVSEVALACVLMVGAGLLARSFAQLTRVERGYDPEHVARAGMVLPGHQYPTAAASREFVRALEERLRAEPGVQTAGVANFPPNYGGIPARAGAGGREPEPVSWRIATPGFFETLRIPLVAGRGFEAGDGPDAPKVALVSAALATRLFGDPASAVGREVTLATWTPEPAVLRVVGVVGDVRQEGRRGDVARDVWQPFSQASFGYVNVLVRSDRLDADALVATIRRAVLALDPQRPIFDYGSFAERTGGDVQGDRFATTLMAAFALVAALLAGIGVAGVMALAVAARTREIGIRVALGGTPAAILRHVVRPGLALVALGAIAGAGLALAASRVLAGQLYGIAPRDPVALVVAVAVVGASGALACWLPARRALRVEPAVALRAD